MTEDPSIQLTADIPEHFRGLRIDQALAKCFPAHSRTRLAGWLKAGQVTVNGESCQPKFKVNGNEQVVISAGLDVVHEDNPEAIPLNIIYEDDELLVVNKQAGIVVHPGAGNRQGTLLNALLFHAPQLKHIPRAGIVHRLDKDTTGLMVVAKTLPTHTALVAALGRREINREYLALVNAEIIAGKTIHLPIGRHPSARTKMAVIASGRPACTHFRCHKRYQGFTLLDVKLDTGRTHQIRVHLSHIGFPIVGDTAYGWRYRIPAQSSLEFQQALTGLKRQALHACQLSLVHPVSQLTMTWQAPLPEDFKQLLSFLTKK